MSLGETNNIAATDYPYCQYPGSRLLFRGPEKTLDGRFIAALGGSETFGLYVHQPFTEILEAQLSVPVVNLGVRHAGVSLFAEEPWLIEVSSRADATILQVMGAQNMSNRLYSVHARRNDRFLSVSTALRDLFPGVDFTEFNFTGHLLQSLADQSPPDFQRLIVELKWAWVQRMKRLVTLIESPVILLWMSSRRPDQHDGLGCGEPMFVDRSMLDALRPQVAAIVEVVSDDRAGSETKAPDDPTEGTIRKAERFPGPRHHSAAAMALVAPLRKIVGDQGPQPSRALG